MSLKNIPRKAALRLYAERTLRLEILLEECGEDHPAMHDEMRLVEDSRKQVAGMREPETQIVRDEIRRLGRDFGASERAAERALRRLLDAAVH